MNQTLTSKPGWQKNLLLALLLLGAVGVSVWRYIALPKAVEPYMDETAVLTLEVSDYPTESLYGYQVGVTLEGVPGVMYYSEETEILPGDRLTARFLVSMPSSIRSDRFFKATIQAEKTDEMQSGAERPEFTVETGGGAAHWPARLCRMVRDRIVFLFEGDTEAFLRGVLTGDSSGFSDALQEDLFTTGMRHLAAVSGLHVSMLVGFFVLIIGNRRWAVFFALPIVVLYVAMTGFTPSAIRAGIMISLSLLTPFFGREYDALSALSISFVVLCWYNPYLVLEPALQLSFTATLGLVLFASKWQKALLAHFPGRGKHPLLDRLILYVCSGASASCAALVFSLPVAAYWFGGVSLISPLCNLLLMGLFTLLFLLGAAAVAASFLWLPLGQFLAVPAEYPARLFRWCIGLLGRIPYSVLYTSERFMVGWLLFAYALFVLFLVTRQWKAPLCAALAGFVLCFSLTVWNNSRFRLEITLLDVGQGSCMVIRSQGETAVIDCGGTPTAGRRLVRFLQSKGVGHVDTLFLTHYDSDHVNGVSTLLENVSVGNVFGPLIEEMPSEFAVCTVESKSLYTVGELSVLTVPVDWLGRSSNDDGLVYLLTMDEFSVLVTGDLDASGERWLTRVLELPQNGIFVAGHHGSAYSNSDMLLEAFRPQAVLISSGAGNTFGHPAPETLGRLAAWDAEVYRTDNSGNITVKVP